MLNASEQDDIDGAGGWREFPPNAACHNTSIEAAIPFAGAGDDSRMKPGFAAGEAVVNVPALLAGDEGDALQLLQSFRDRGRRAATSGQHLESGIGLRAITQDFQRRQY